MQTYLEVAQIVLSLVMIVVLLLQVKGAGLGGIFGQQTGVYRTKRGMEKTLFRFTLILVIIFVLVSIFAVISAS